MNRSPNFDNIARPYRVLEYLTLGRMLERTRLHFLPRILTARRALVLGDGDGRFLAQLFAVNPDVHATAIDSSGEMLRLLREKCKPYFDRLHTVHADALSFTPPVHADYDLVVSHFFMDCFTEAQLNELVDHIAPALKPDALWLLSDFRIASGRMHLPAEIVVRGLYFAFRVITGLRIVRLPCHSSILSAAGFNRRDRKLLAAGLLHTELWQREAPPETPRQNL